MQNYLERLKLEYDYRKTWLLTFISLFITSSIGFFTVDHNPFKIVLGVLCILSVTGYLVFFALFHISYDALKGSYK